MNNHVRKLITSSRKPFVRTLLLKYGEDPQDWANILSEFGLNVYSDPYTSSTRGDQWLIISNKRLTYGWYVKHYKALFGNDVKRWAFNYVVAWHKVNDELDYAN